MGRVFLGQSPGGRLVAVKVIRPELAGDPDFRNRFAREVATARTVSGIFTAPVVDADLTAAQPWLVTEYVDGPSLADAVAGQGPLPLGSALALAAGLAEGLAAIHAADVAHRDLKPSNVLLARDGPRIIDFGISRAADATALTRTGWVSGSPGFMSPEQADGLAAGAPSDMFSLGAVLAYAASGREPFGTGPATALLYRVVHAPPELTLVPVPLRPLVERCLAKDPTQRPGATELLAELGPARPAADWLPWTAGRPGGPVPTEPAQAGAGWPGPGDPRTVTSAPQPHPPYLPPAPWPAAQPGPGPVGPPGPAAPWPGGPQGLGGAPGPLVPGLELAGSPTRPMPRRAARFWPVAVIAAVAVAAAGVFVSHRLTGGSPTRIAAAPPAPASSATGSAGTEATRGTAWTRYQDPSGFSVDLPPGWAESTQKADETYFTGTPAGYVVVVAWTTHPRSNQVADWRQQSAGKAAADPTYRKISIRPVAYRGWGAADWQFTNIYQGQLTRVTDLGFIVRPRRLGYAIEMYGPAAGWQSVYDRVWGRLTRSFTPAG